jgi:hypothetical protein
MIEAGLVAATSGEARSGRDVKEGGIALSTTRLIAWAGPLTILAGALWGVASVGEMAILIKPANADTFWDSFYILPFILSFVPLLFALIGIRLRYDRSAGMPGRLGLALSVAGCAGMIGFALTVILLGVMAPEADQSAWPNVVLAVSFLAFVAGFILFGVDALRYRLLPRWNVLPFLVGAAVLFRLAPDWLGVRNYHPLQLAAYFLHLAITGACWVLLGLAMLDQRPGSEPAAAL